MLFAQGAHRLGMLLPFGMLIGIDEFLILEIPQLHFKAEAIAQGIIGHPGMEIGASIAEGGNIIGEAMAEHFRAVEHHGALLFLEGGALALGAGFAADAVDIVIRKIEEIGERR